MKFLVSTNFQDDFIGQLDRERVYCIYGKLTADFVGGGRPSFIIPSVGAKQVQEHVRQAHNNGLEFNYLLNATCLCNKEYTISGQRRIRSLLDWLLKIKVDAVTVSIPYLAQLIKKEYPQFKIHISVSAGVDCLRKARYWQELGADCITLQSTSLNRDFASLKNIRKNVNCKLALIVNESCLYKCPVQYYHYTSSSHASQSGFFSGASCVDYCILSCKRMRIKEPLNVIRSAWIRPEDLHYYEELGIDYFKIVDRSKDTNFLLNVVNAYINRSYKGNLADLFPLTSRSSSLRGIKKYMRYLQCVLHPFTVNLFKIRKVFENLYLDIYLDNKALDGFLDFFVQGKCKQGICEECGYCKEVSERAVKIDKSYRNKALSKYDELIDKVVSGKPFRYF